MSHARFHIYEGTDRKSLSDAIEKEIHRFEESYGAYNILKMQGDLDLTLLRQELETSGFLSSEKLILIYNLDLTEKSEDDAGKNFSEELLGLLEEASEDRTIFFVAPRLDSRTKLAKFLATNAEKHIFSRDLHAVNLPTHLVRILEERTQGNENVREDVLEKIDLYRISEEIDKNFIDDIVPESPEAVIFSVIDAIRDGHIREARKNLMDLIQKENIFSVFSSLITNIRTALIILTLREKNASDADIAGLGIHPFVVKKTRGNSETKKRLHHFLTLCIQDDIAQKSGKGFSDTELGMIFSIDRALLQLQKIKTRYTGGAL